MQENKTQKKWFKNKVYGYGWYPATKEGWYVIVAFMIILFATAYIVSLVTSSEEVFSIVFLFLALIETLGLLYIATKKGEKPRWSWGKKDSK